MFWRDFTLFWPNGFGGNTRFPDNFHLSFFFFLLQSPLFKKGERVTIFSQLRDSFLLFLNVKELLKKFFLKLLKKLPLKLLKKLLSFKNDQISYYRFARYI